MTIHPCSILFRSSWMIPRMVFKIPANFSIDINCLTEFLNHQPSMFHQSPWLFYHVTRVSFPFSSSRGMRNQRTAPDGVDGIFWCHAVTEFGRRTFRSKAYFFSGARRLFRGFGMLGFLKTGIWSTKHLSNWHLLGGKSTMNSIGPIYDDRSHHFRWLLWKMLPKWAYPDERIDQFLFLLFPRRKRRFRTRRLLIFYWIVH